jgi:hypothetical protein
MLAERFMRLFAGLDRAHGKYTITRKNESKNKIEGRANTVHEPVTLDLWKKHLAGEQGLGIIPIMDDANVHWGALDIDSYDMDLLALEKQCKELDLPFFLCKTKSGGAHLYVFFDEPVPAKVVRAKLAEFSVSLGHPGVEIFPKQVSLASKNDVGNWLNMPYFGGDKSERYCIHFGKQLTAEEFVELAFKYRITQDAFVNTVPYTGTDFSDGPPCLQTLAMRGFGEGSRNKALFNVGVYLRMKFEDEWEGELEKANHAYMRPPLPSREVVALTKSVSRKDYSYTCKLDPIASCCNVEICKQREFGVKIQGEDISLVIGSLVKITSTPPTWIIDVEGYRLEMTTEELLSQDAFRRICVERINKYPPKVQPFVWEKMIREKLENVDEQIAPPDASPEGRLDYHVKQFCNEFSRAKSRDELLSGKPWFDESSQRIYFRSPDLIKYLSQQHFKDMTPREIWAYLRRMGADHHQFNVKEMNVQCWSIKQEDYERLALDIGVVESENF